jgi:hypothetical protein
LNTILSHNSLNWVVEENMNILNKGFICGAMALCLAGSAYAKNITIAYDINPENGTTVVTPGTPGTTVVTPGNMDSGNGTTVVTPGNMDSGNGTTVVTPGTPGTTVTTPGTPGTTVITP